MSAARLLPAALGACGLALGALSFQAASAPPPRLPARPASSAAAGAGDVAPVAFRESASSARPLDAHLAGADEDPRDALERVVAAASRRLATGDCDAGFDAEARLTAQALVERHGAPRRGSLEALLADPDASPAAAVLAGHLGWTALPPGALHGLEALWRDLRVEGAGQGNPEADAAYARALAIAPALYLFAAPGRRDALLAALVDPAPLRRRLARSVAASADPLDAARRVARLAATAHGAGVDQERLCVALRQCLDRVADPAALDRLTLEIARERAEAWSRHPAPSALRGRGASLQRSLARFPR